MNIFHINKNFFGAAALQDVCVSFNEGDIHGLLGANGAGKSTLIKIIMNFNFPDNGRIVRPDHISLLPENPYLPSNLSAFQIISHACRIQGENDVEHLLNEVRLKKSAWHQPIRTYSKGMKQRTSIAYSLVGNPEWLILDEPMSGLDAMGRKQMLEVFAEKKCQGVSILMCSHSVTDLVRLCDKVHIMASGKLCETVNIQDHSMTEVENLESCLYHWSAEHVMD